MVASSGRRGTRVLPPPPVDDATAATDEIEATIRAARKRGLDAASILDAVTRTLATD